MTSHVDARRVCTWCTRPLPEGKRVDAKTCSKPCRQAAHRFRVGVAPAAAGRPMRFAYADPPYPGLARKYYGCDEVDHEQLVARLVAEHPDGWALSTSAAACQDVLALCPRGTRVCAWVRGPRKTPSRWPLNAWEPLLVFGGRARLVPVVEDLSDVLLWGGRQHSHPGALVGMKSAAFCEWMFRMLGAAQGDELVDIFPGSGAVGRAWALYTSPEYSRDASRPGRHDLSPAAARDASPRGGGDASRAARGDTKASGDASHQYSHDTSDGADATRRTSRLPSRLAGAARRLENLP